MLRGIKIFLTKIVWFSVLIGALFVLFEQEYYLSRVDTLTGLVKERLLDIDNALSLGDTLFSQWFPLLLVGLVWAQVGVLTLLYLLRFLGLYHPAMYRYALFIPWRTPYRLWNRFCIWRESVFSFGKTATANFANTLFMLASVYTPDKVMLGRLWLFGFGWIQPIGVTVKRHMVMIAGTGGGKTVTAQTLVGLHKGSVFVIDPKYQIMDTMSKGRKRLGKVFHLTPLRKGSHSYNIFDEIKAAEQREGIDAITRYFIDLAALLVPKHARETPFWTNNEKMLSGGLLAYVYLYPTEERNLLTFRDLLMNGLCPEKFEHKKDAFDFLLDEMQHCTALDGFISKAAMGVMSAGETARGNILAGVRGATQWMDLTQVRNISRRSDFLLCDLKLQSDKEPMSVFLGAPTTVIQGALAPWFLMITAMSMTVFEHIEGELKNPCLYVLDEMPSLGRIPQLEISAAVLRSFGVRLLAITQDIDLLKKTYPHTWESFIGNADIVWWMATNHQGNINYLCNILGKTARAVGGVKNGSVKVEYPLLDNDQARRFLDSDHQNIIVTRCGKRPMRLKIPAYHKELPVWSYDPDKNFKEALAKAWVRRLINVFTSSKTDSIVQKAGEPVNEEPIDL